MALFNDMGNILDNWLGLSGIRIGEPPQYRHQSTINQLAANPFRARSFNLTSSLLSFIEERVKNGTGRPGSENWRFRQLTEVDPRNDEVLLERTLIHALMQRGDNSWGNSIPIASGVCEPGADGRMAVDLVKRDNSDLSLIELKVNANTPLYAAFEILGYGLCYAIARALPVKFGCRGDAELFQNKGHVLLRVLAPRAYYGNNSQVGWLLNLEDRINKDLQSLDLPFRCDDCKYDMNFCFEVFSDEFLWDRTRSDNPIHQKAAANGLLNRKPLKSHVRQP